uniref:Calcium channel flower n=1 Tax=Corethrella appendiculata TaxID=1370023 RepID=U5EYA5_9DIPT
MSFAERVAGLMARPGQGDAVDKDDVPWYLKYAGRAVGIIGGFFAVLFGLYNCIGILLGDISCLISGVLQILAGFVVLAIEAPFCFMFIDFVSKIAEMADNRPYWNRAVLYCAIAIPPVILCLGLGSLFGCGLLFATGMLYGMMSLGKKASAEEMRNAATVVDNKNIPTSTTNTSQNSRVNLVNNAQPISFTGPPAFDSNA